MAKEYVIGLDLGTTSVKACVFHRSGQLMAEAEKMNTFHYPKQGWVEQDAAEIERSAVLAVREAIRQAGISQKELLAVGLSAAMHSLVCVDKDGHPLSPALIWADGRSAPRAEQLRKTMGKTVYAKTGTPVHPMTPLAKLLWMKETKYTPYERAFSFLSIKEYVVRRWFHTNVIDYSMASATGLFNPSTFQWEPELLKLAGIREDQLSELVPPTYVMTGVDEAVAEQMGIPRDLPFVIGAADGQLANLGIGAIFPGEVAVSVGTSGAVRQMTHEPKMSENGETFCYAFTKERFIIGGPSNNGGIALQWLKDIMNDQRSFSQFLEDAARAVPGADGLIFLPYINGERAPLWDPRAKGGFYGATVTHKQEHFIRAVMEGITFNLYQIGKALETLAGKPKKLYVSGGLARSPLWLQILADVFDAEIGVPKSHHGAAWGAAWTALVAIGEAESLEAIKAHIPMGETVMPNEDNRKAYKEVYERYERLVRHMASYFQKE